MITTLFYIFLFLAIWHFFYEGVIAPALRHGLRYNFFHLRDQLRTMNIEGLSKHDQKIYNHLDHAVCGIIESMSFISVGNYFLLKKSQRKEDTKKLKDLIMSADNPELRKIDYKMAGLGARALIINNGAWLVYLFIPLSVYFVCTFFFLQFDRLSKSAAKVSSRLIYSHENNQGFGLA